MISMALSLPAAMLSWRNSALGDVADRGGLLDVDLIKVAPDSVCCVMFLHNSNQRLQILASADLLAF